MYAQFAHVEVDIYDAERDVEARQTHAKMSGNNDLSARSGGSHTTNCFRVMRIDGFRTLCRARGRRDTEGTAVWINKEKQYAVAHRAGHYDDR